MANRTSLHASALSLLLLLGGCAARQAPQQPVATVASIPDTPPPPAPAGIRPLLGEYVSGGDTLLIREAGGRLDLLVRRGGEFVRPDESMPSPSTAQAHRDAAGRVTGITLDGRSFDRRPLGPDDGAVFRIDPVRPVSELRAEAAAATPPVETGKAEPDLVEVVKLSPGFQLDVRYATPDNFMGEPFYTEPRVFLQRPAAEALVRAQQRLARYGYGIRLHDGYRPWSVTKMFWDATPDAQKDFVADPAKGSRHNRGAAIDLSLYDLRTGEPVEMPSGYDEFSDRALPDYPGGTSRQRWLRDLLRSVMEAEGFSVYRFEWWHFDYADSARWPILNLPFDRITDRR